jgi:acyl-CoA reductase-like NAD-dependent aldehyde dehydrogenase
MSRFIRIGPLVSERQHERVEGYIRCGREEGAKVLAGGGRPTGLDHGWFVERTIFIDVDPSTRIAQEEIFRPVLSILTSFGDEGHAMAIANYSSYGLGGSVFAADAEHALSVARRIRTGTVELSGNLVGFYAPTCGFKCNGIGRELGLEGFNVFVDLKSYGLPPILAEALS